MISVRITLGLGTYGKLELMRLGARNPRVRDLELARVVGASRSLALGLTSIAVSIC